MSFTFRVIFDGVLAYVPDKPFFERCENGECKDEERQIYHTCSEHECCTIDEKGNRICYCCDQREKCWKRRDDTINPKNPASGPVRSMAVLVPDLRRPGVPNIPGSAEEYLRQLRELTEVGERYDLERHLRFPKLRDPHFPLLRFRLSDLRENTTRRVDLVCRDISRQDEEGVLFLRREQIRFSMEAENAKNFSFAGWAPCPPPPYDDLQDCCKKLKRLPEWWGKRPDLSDREQLESLWWLPDLDRIIVDDNHKDAVHARPEVLPSYRGPFPEGLIARIECSGGRLRTYDFNRDVDGVPVVWTFAPPNDLGNPKKETWKRAIANSLALEFFDVRDEVRIQLKRLANEVVVEELVLAPAPGAARPVLEIEISNREPDLLFQEESFNRSSLPDMDFQPFYEVLSGADRGKILDLPIPFPGRESFFGVVEKPCAGTGMKGQGT